MRSSVPPVTLKNRVAASVIVPPAAFVKLGLAPVWVTVKVPLPVTAIVPLFTCAALACASVSVDATVSVLCWSSAAASVVGPFTVIVPRFTSSAAVTVRAPPKPASTVSVPPGAFVSVPVVTVRFATYPASMFVSSIAPVFVKPVVTVSAAVLFAPLPSTRIVDPTFVASADETLVVPRAMNVPRFAKVAIDRDPPATVTVP